MKCRVIWPGKSRESWIRAAVEEYAARIRRYTPLSLVELKEEKGGAQELVRLREGERLLKQLAANTVLALLDEHGEQMDSVTFASYIGRHRERGTQELAFAIGGAYGLSEQVRQRADVTISLSRMTFTHQMVRPFLLEQIYRAFTILNNEPYHH